MCRLRLVSENDLFLTLGFGTSNARNENLRPLLNTNIPLISGNYGLRNHFWPLESRFLMRKNEKKSIFSKPPQCLILSFWILSLHIIICQFKKNPPWYIFCVSPHVPATSEKHYQVTDPPTWIQEMLAHLKRQWYSRKYAFRPIFEKLLQQASHTKRRIIVRSQMMLTTKPNILIATTMVSMR